MGGPSLYQEGSWQFAQPSAEGTDNQSAEGSENDPFMDDRDLTMDSPTPSLRSSSQDPLPALQQTAERVSRQVEEFAKSLDQFCSKGTDSSDNESWARARKLVLNYQQSIQTRINNINQRSGISKLKRKGSLSQEQEDELQSCELEADTWDIFYALLELQDPAARAELQDSQNSALDGLHRYSSDVEVWEAFLRSDGFAQECLTILKWLQRTAEKSRPPIEEIIAGHTSKSQRQNGVWPTGWLYTKMAIKNAKRLRAWPKPLDPDAPGLQSSLRINNSSEPVVSQLDPDAATRQQKALASEDVHHENACWIACWEMLRRGVPYADVEGWWKERKESWRAASILGASRDPSTNPTDAGVSWMISLPRKVRSRAMTILSSADLKLDEHEAAVYGLLCSQTQPSLAVCTSIDDYLFVYFSNLLLNCYHRFCDAYHEKAFSGKQVQLRPTAPQYELISHVLANSQHQPNTEEESRIPVKVIQAAIVSKRYDQLFIRTGKALSMLANKAGDSSLMYADDNAMIDDSAMATAQDPEALRTVAHLLVLLKSFGLVDLYGADEQYAQNCISGYVGVLREEAKMELIPLYISRLTSHERQAQTLGTVIIDITDPVEREVQVRLMGKYRIDIGNVLETLFKSLIGEKQPTGEPGFRPVDVVQYIGVGKSRTLKIKADFIGADITNEEELLVRCMEWYQYVNHRDWHQCCTAASILYIQFLANGRLAAARALATRAPLETLSKRITKMNLSLPDSADLSEDEYEGEPDGLPAEEKSKSVSPSKFRRRSSAGASSPPNLTQMRQQAQTWRELEQLVHILYSLETWSVIADETEMNHDDLKRAKHTLGEALDDVKMSTYPIFAPGYLNQPLEPEEAEPLLAIREFYIPEIILAYHSVLHLAGHYLTRDHLTECMDLATEVATIPELTDVFMTAGRMAEFVEQCAMSAKSLLFANEQGGSKSKKKKAGIAGNTDIWHVKSTKKSLHEQMMSR